MVEEPDPEDENEYIKIDDACDEHDGADDESPDDGGDGAGAAVARAASAADQPTHGSGTTAVHIDIDPKYAVPIGAPTERFPAQWWGAPGAREEAVYDRSEGHWRTSYYTVRALLDTEESKPHDMGVLPDGYVPLSLREPSHRI